MLLYEAEIKNTFRILTLACNVFNFSLTMVKYLLHFTDKPAVAFRVFKACS